MTMLNSKADSVVLGYLGRALSMELSAVQLYSTQAKLVETWGLTEIASKLSDEANEELEHANRIIGRMLALGVAPNASQLRPVRLGHSVQELLQNDYAFENELVLLYENAVKYCVAKGDHDNRLFFDYLLTEERSHAQALFKWLQQLEETSLASMEK